jgi:predicted HAD superfamily Cof-like phosphohydrolase
MTYFTDVGEFHAKMGLPVAGKDAPATMRYVDFKYRTAFLFEELREFIEAHARGDTAEAADALADLIWVACGTAHYMQVPLDAIWAEIRRANMEKRPWQEGDPLKPRNAATQGEVVKPRGWRPPDIVGVLSSYIAGLRGRLS